MAMKMIGAILGLAAIAGSGCAAPAADANSEGDERARLASPTPLSIPAPAQAYETARAIDFVEALRRLPTADRERVAAAITDEVPDSEKISRRVEHVATDE